jgi:hypothetical protein
VKIYRHMQLPALSENHPAEYIFDPAEYNLPNFTTMDPILAAIPAIDLHKDGDKPLYRQIAKRFGIDRTTLAQRHQGLMCSNAGEALRRMLLTP